MNKIIWKGDRFECNNLELEDAKFEALRGDNKRLHEFMAACDLSMDGYGYDINWNLHIHRKTGQGKVVLLPIADEGTGFNVCFHLGAYAIASMNLGQKLEISAYSFKPLLHPVLFAGLSKWFSDRPAQEIDKNCSYYSGDSTLKCAVNPSLPCKDCSDVSAGFNESLFVWKASEWQEANWIDCLEASMAGCSVSPRWDFRGRLESVAISIPRIASGEEAIARLRRVIPEQPFTEGVVGIDMGSGEEATAITTGFTAEDGSVLINSLEINTSTSVFADAIARLQETVSRSMMLPERLLHSEGQGVADHRRESYRCELSDRIAPLPPRLEEARQGYERHSATVWAQFGGVAVYPQPHRMPIPQELYGVMEDAEQRLPSQLGMTFEEISSHKASGTLVAEMHRRSQLERTNKINNQVE